MKCQNIYELLGAAICRKGPFTCHVEPTSRTLFIGHQGPTDTKVKQFCLRNCIFQLYKYLKPAPLPVTAKETEKIGECTHLTVQE